MNKSSPVKLPWSLREYQEGDEEQIRELRGTALSGSRDSQWWQWLYRNGPAGPALIWVAEAKQKIVGHNALLPLNTKIGNQTCRGSLGIDVMVHPEYQRQGILTMFRTKMPETAIKNGISITFGTVNNQTFSIYRRLQTDEICELPLLVKIITWGNILKRRFKIPTFAGNLLGYAWERMTIRTSSLQNADIEIEQISSFDERIDNFWLKASEIKQIMVIKDMKYLNWRYVEKPGNEYKIFVAKRHKEIVGYIVLTLERGDLPHGYIIDLLTLPREDIVTEVLITRAIRYLQEEGAATITCWMLKDTPYYRTLRKLGFIHRRSRLRLAYRLRDPNLSKEFVANPSNWYYVMGDSDTK